MKTLLVIFTNRRHFVPFVNLNILFVLMLFSGKFAIEMYAVGIINRVQDTMDENIATIFLGKLICFAFYKYFAFVLSLRSCQFHWLGYLSHYSEVFEEEMDIDVFSICNGNCSHYSRSVTHRSKQVSKWNISGFCQSSQGDVIKSWVSLICLLIFMFFAPIGLCSIPFMYIAEMFPLEVHYLQIF